jgi:hypothetical protein
MLPVKAVPTVDTAGLFIGFRVAGDLFKHRYVQ